MVGGRGEDGEGEKEEKLRQIVTEGKRGNKKGDRKRKGKRKKD